ncbi:MAG: tryptophan 7-halogenase [Saprospiraceae bacterium]|nr:tryptophan 7-halogenase [Saprospiraceae bacterium]
MHIAIIGNGIQANLGALYLRKQFGDRLQITLVGPDDRGGLPVVGESIIEITTHFVEKHLGMTEYLRDHHLPKYALTYYFKIDPDNPEDRTYSVHCNERAPADCRRVPGWTGPMDHPPSWLLNREVFDRDLRAMTARKTASTGSKEKSRTWTFGPMPVMSFISVHPRARLCPWKRIGSSMSRDGGNCWVENWI